jgi:hypothetical protein
MNRRATDVQRSRVGRLPGGFEPSPPLGAPAFVLSCSSIQRNGMTQVVSETDSHTQMGRAPSDQRAHRAAAGTGRPVCVA